MRIPKIHTENVFVDLLLLLSPIDSTIYNYKKKRQQEQKKKLNVNESRDFRFAFLQQNENVMLLIKHRRKPFYYYLFLSCVCNYFSKFVNLHLNVCMCVNVYAPSLAFTVCRVREMTNIARVAFSFARWRYISIDYKNKNHNKEHIFNALLIFTYFLMQQHRDSCWCLSICFVVAVKCNQKMETETKRKKNIQIKNIERKMSCHFLCLLLFSNPNRELYAPSTHPFVVEYESMLCSECECILCSENNTKIKDSTNYVSLYELSLPFTWNRRQHFCRMHKFSLNFHFL